MATGYQQLVGGVLTRAELEDADQARQGTIHVLETLARSLGDAPRVQVQRAIPAGIRRCIRWDNATVAHQQPDTFVAEVARRTDLPMAPARKLVQAVLSELAHDDPILTESLRNWLPAELTAFLTIPAQATGPSERQRSGSVHPVEPSG